MLSILTIKPGFSSECSRSTLLYHSLVVISGGRVGGVLNYVSRSLFFGFYLVSATLYDLKVIAQRVEIERIWEGVAIKSQFYFKEGCLCLLGTQTWLKP